MLSSMWPLEKQRWITSLLNHSLVALLTFSFRQDPCISRALHWVRPGAVQGAGTVTNKYWFKSFHSPNIYQYLNNLCAHLSPSFVQELLEMKFGSLLSFIASTN